MTMSSAEADSVDEALDIIHRSASTIAARWVVLYRVLDWQWSSDRPAHVPSQADIAGLIRELVAMVRAQKRKTYASSGGITVSVEDGCVSVSFSDDFLVHL